MAGRVSWEDWVGIARENSARGRAWRKKQLNVDYGTRRFYRLINKAIEEGRIVPVKVVYCADDPTKIDPTLSVITVEQMLKFIRDSGLKDYGRTVAKMLGESDAVH
jgi:hypothetical protein